MPEGYSKDVRKIEPFNIEGHAEGTVTASYADALNLDVRGFRSKTIFLRNTHATLTMKYKLLASLFYPGGYEEELVAETTLSAVSTAQMICNNSYARLRLQVIDGTGHATYSVDYTMSGI
jgi:hypothetical protein